MKTQLENKAKQLISKLNTEELVKFAKTCPNEIIDFVLNELEIRLPENKFLELCETL